MIDVTKNLGNLSVKRPDADDVKELLPVFVALVVMVLTNRSGKVSLSIALPALAALVAWLLVKGLRYVPR